MPFSWSMGLSVRCRFGRSRVSQINLRPLQKRIARMQLCFPGWGLSGSHMKNRSSIQKRSMRLSNEVDS